MGHRKRQIMSHSIFAVALTVALATAAPFLSSPDAECNIATGLKCAAAVKPCLAQCKTGAKACIECLGGDIGTCCPCLEKLPVLKKLPITCPNANGCLSDEVGIQIQGVKGDFCTPKCTGLLKMSCPQDVPSGVTAKPQCALKDQSGDKYCALICSPSTDEESLRAGDAACGKATCKAIQGVGVCTYDD